MAVVGKKAARVEDRAVDRPLDSVVPAIELPGICFDKSQRMLNPIDITGALRSALVLVYDDVEPLVHCAFDPVLRHD